MEQLIETWNNQTRVQSSVNNIRTRGLMTIQVETMTASEAARRIAAASLTSRALVRACLERINARESAVEAWAFIDADLALAQADICDRSAAAGPLHGVPLGVKDVFDTYDMPTTYGSSLYKNHRPSRDAASVALARGDGAIILGKTVTCEFGFFAPGKTRNPHDPDRTPGGSSSGSAAAVADGMIPFSVGLQTAGSIIRPAAYCGVVGFKPSMGRISRSGSWSFAESLDTPGTFARTVDDAALLAASLSRQAFSHRDQPMDRQPKIGIYETHHWKQAQPETQGAIDDAARILGQAGAQVSRVQAVASFGELVESQTTVMAYEACNAFAFELRESRNALSPQLLDLLDYGSRISAIEYEKALRQRSAAILEFARILEDLDVLLTPSAIGEAPVGLDSTGDPLFNRAWTFLGAPTIHLPAFTGPNRMPVGVQLVGPINGEERLIAVSRWAEARLRSITTVPVSRPGRTKNDGND